MGRSQGDDGPVASVGPSVAWRSAANDATNDDGAAAGKGVETAVDGFWVFAVGGGIVGAVVGAGEGRNKGGVGGRAVDIGSDDFDPESLESTATPVDASALTAAACASQLERKSTEERLALATADIGFLAQPRPDGGGIVFFEKKSQLRK
jgi:hypothetical protein